MRKNILGICLIIMIIILFFYGLAIRSMEVRVQTIEDSIVENNLWGKLDQVQDAALESLKQINRMPKAQD